MISALAVALVLAQATAETAALPAPVARFVERRTNCDHWAGEEPYDADRRREIERALRALRCDRLDRDEQALAHRYRSRADVRRALKTSQDGIE